MDALTVVDIAGWVEIERTWGAALRTRLADGSEGPVMFTPGFHQCEGNSPAAVAWVESFCEEMGSPPYPLADRPPVSRGDAVGWASRPAPASCGQLARGVLNRAMRTARECAGELDAMTYLNLFPLAALTTQWEWAGWVAMMQAAMIRRGIAPETAREICSPVVRALARE